MYTSDIDTSNRKSCMTQATAMLFATAFTALFGAIYEYFSHGVYSYFMIYAFAPLLAAGIIYLLQARFAHHPFGAAVRNIFTALAATAAVGMVAQGVVFIYGSTNRLTAVYAVITAALIPAFIIARLLELKKHGKTVQENV
ncbi:MAG: hypothetical protein IJ740_18070 [Ruminococcus sp.]|nr:hypothetical protein [Ruminococcus sp.]